MGASGHLPVRQSVYDSLTAQTFRDFEWLVVDDGSTDGTRALIEAWRDEADFPIRYYHQKNQGKHVAYNHSVPHARGRFFLTLDSDEACVPHALEKLKLYWDTTEINQGWPLPCCAWTRRGRVVGDRFPHRITDSDSLECNTDSRSAERNGDSTYFRVVRGVLW